MSTEAVAAAEEPTANAKEGTHTMRITSRHRRLAYVIASYAAGAAHFAYKSHLLPERLIDMGPGFAVYVAIAWLLSPLWVFPALIAVPVYLMLHSASPFEVEVVYGWPLFVGTCVLAALLLAWRSGSGPAAALPADAADRTDG